MVNQRQDSEFHSELTVHNILIVGETGVGKSSVVNLIARDQFAKVDAVARARTLEASSYPITISDHHGLDHHIRLFDTVGVNEPQLKKKDSLLAIEKANTLICQLQRTSGIRLLLFCIRAGRITMTTQNIYRLFCEILCQNKVAVVLVITGLENEEPMEHWWEENESSLQACGLSCNSHVCVAAIRGRKDCFAKEYHESQRAMRAMLLAHVTGVGMPWRPDWAEWNTQLVGKSLRWRGGGQTSAKKELAHHLQDKCKFTQPDAKHLAASIWTKRWENTGLADLRPFNVVLFGEPGAGRSSVVNLIAGNKLAETSPDADACTFTSRPYRVVLRNRAFCIWETTSFHKPDISLDDYLYAIRQAYKLIKEIECLGGVHLLLFCMCSGRITKSAVQDYKLFTKVLCKKKVPACVVVTGLEKQQCMDAWWSENAEELERGGIFADGHVCITTNPGVGHAYCDKYEESKESIHKLLLESRLKLSSEGVIKKFSRLLRRSSQPSPRQLKELLVKECGFPDEVAVGIAISIEQLTTPDRCPVALATNIHSDSEGDSLSKFRETSTLFVPDV